MNRLLNPLLYGIGLGLAIFLAQAVETGASAQDFVAAKGFEIISPLITKAGDGKTQYPLSTNTLIRYGFNSGSSILLKDGRLMMVYCAEDAVPHASKGELRAAFPSDGGITWSKPEQPYRLRRDSIPDKAA